MKVSYTMRLRFAVRHLLASVITISVIVIINQGTISVLLNHVFGGHVIIVHPYVHLASSSNPCLRSTKHFGKLLHSCLTMSTINQSLQLDL